MAEITDFGPRKTVFILAIVAGCFAVLWPKIFYPMLTASVTPHHTSDSSACCDVIFQSDVNAADIMYEICQNILKHHQVDPRVRDALKTIKLTPQSASLCREEILARCGIDLSTFLAERESLGKSNKQVLEEIRSFNGSLCLKMHFGIPLSQLGTPHLIRYHILMPHITLRQERRTPPHAGGLHPALRERGRAIPSSHIVPKVVDRPDHVVPKMRPPLGGAGHVVSAPKGSSTMGIIMPLYTLGIVLFFLYTIVKVLKKNSDSEIISEYPGVAAEKEFRKMVFSPEAFASAMTGGTMHYQKDRSETPEGPAPTIEELKDLDGPPKSKDLAGVDHSSKDGTVVQAEHSNTDDEVENIENSPTVKVMGMEMTASCEGKGSRPTTPIIPISPSHVEREKTPPKPIYLEGALPPQCELLVTDSKTQAQKAEEDTEAPVVLSGKMTLSLISLDQNAAESEDENHEVQETEDAITLDMDDKEKESRVKTLESGIQENVQIKTETEHANEDYERREMRIGEDEDEEDEDEEDEVEDEEIVEEEVEEEDEEVVVEEYEEEEEEDDDDDEEEEEQEIEIDNSKNDNLEEEKVEIDNDEDEEEVGISEYEEDDDPEEEEEDELDEEEEEEEEEDIEELPLDLVRRGVKTEIKKHEKEEV
ncbi:HIV Tat-specific factor 1 homolog isoform X2 [Hylaeus volcanicus]|uniref:HIV Tat-specific factor 1 homolog isoform X2 n=1 Tax=Hylaeus volcanicus TaxID=313075 RepID=UPI0023B857CB|nr:HIV Tat-specific factor 1 homolog isoform X2 [Hylaeus volcanicus]